jgi:hypothetical protein
LKLSWPEIYAVNLCGSQVGWIAGRVFTLCSLEFSAKEKEKIQKAAFRAKPKARLAESFPMEFNGARLILEGDQLYLRQKGQGKKLKLVDAQAEDRD